MRELALGGTGVGGVAPRLVDFAAFHFVGHRRRGGIRLVVGSSIPARQNSWL